MNTADDQAGLEEKAALRFELQRRRQREDDVFQMLPVGFIATNVHGTIRQANRAACQLFSVRSDFVVGKPVFALLHPADRRAWRQLLVRAREDGFVRHESARLTPTRGNDPRDTVVSVVTDGPEVSSRESEVLWLIEDRTGENPVDESDRARRDLERAKRDKDDLLGMVSHELRTPLTIVYGNAELLHLHRDKLTSEQREAALAEIYESSRQLTGLIENMLLLSRLDRSQIEPEPVLLQRLLPRIVDERRMKLEGHPLDLDVDGALPPVMGDEGWITQVVDNLVSNAAKYSPPTSPIEVRARSRPTAVTVAVLDEGPGIPAEELETVFEPFARSDSTALMAAGLGLGLTVCQRLVNAMSGELSIHPRPGRGLEAAFWLPVAAGADPDVE